MAAECSALRRVKEFDVVVLAPTAVVELRSISFVLTDEELAPRKVEGVNVKVEGVIEEEFELVEELGSRCILG